MISSAENSVRDNRHFPQKELEMGLRKQIFQMTRIQDGVGTFFIAFLILLYLFQILSHHNNKKRKKGMFENTGSRDS